MKYASERDLYNDDEGLNLILCTTSTNKYILITLHWPPMCLPLLDCWYEIIKMCNVVELFCMEFLLAHQ